MTIGHIIGKEIHGLVFKRGAPHPYEKPVDPRLLAQGYPRDPPNEAIIPLSEISFMRAETGNYAN